MFQTSRKISAKNKAEEKAAAERFRELFITSNFIDWAVEDTIFFFKYLVEHPQYFTSYTVKIEKDVLNHTSDNLLVKKVLDLINEYTDAFDPGELASNWQMIEYHVALFQHLQKFLKENFTKGKENGQICSEG